MLDAGIGNHLQYIFITGGRATSDNLTIKNLELAMC